MTFKELRQSAGLTQVELAKRVGVPFQTIQKYEWGVCKVENMSLMLAKKMAAALGISTDELAEVEQ